MQEERTPIRKYTVELWHKLERLVLDVSDIVESLDFTITRNRYEDVSFKLPGISFIEFCQAVNEDPEQVLMEYVTVIKIKKDGQYLPFAAEVIDASANANEGGRTISVKARGLGSILEKAFVEKTYGSQTNPANNVEATEIAWDLIDTYQQKAYANFGFTKSDIFYETGVKRFRNYTGETPVYDMVVNLTKLVTGNFDFRFNQNGEFETYQNIGSPQYDTPLNYPGNIKEYSVPKTASSLANFVTGVGSGFGDEAIKSYASDIISATIYGRREDIYTASDVSVQETLDEQTEGYVNERSERIKIPQVTVSGEVIDINKIGIGDILPVKLDDDFLKVDGYFRIEQINVKPDKQGYETIILSFDDFGVESII